MKPKLWLTLAAVSLLAACSPLTIIDAPTDGATLPSNSYSIVVHTGVGVCVIEIQVEGKDPSLYTWQTSRQASGCGIGGTIGNPVPEQFEWIPPGPGTYTIKARGFLYAEQQYGPWATVKVTVSDEPLTIGEIPGEAFGPQAWVDAPIDGSELPLAPYEVVAHASSPNGVASFEFSVNGVVENPTLVNPDQLDQTLAYVMFMWTPPAPGTYRLSVRAADASGGYGPAAQAFVTVGRGEAPPEPALTQTPTLEPKACTITALVNLFCRLGPGYEPIDEFKPGQSAKVLAQSEFLWKVIGLNSGEDCTVPKNDSYVETKGDCTGLPIFTPPPPPTATFTPIPTDTPIPVQGCTVRQAGGAIICVAPCPAGAAPGEACTP